jgi:uncharacterized protein (TIGR03437 family)
VNPQAGSIVFAFHPSFGAPVTTSFPATPNEQISVGATGLGPTNPVFATGTAPNNESAVTITRPTVNVGGKPVTVLNAFLGPNNPGFYVVVFTMRADATTGNQQINVSIGGLTSNTGLLPVATGPVIASVTNAATYIAAGPRSGIAQGSIFVIKGINLGPAAISIASAAFQNTSLSGTSVAVTVSGTTVAALMYYTSAGQLAALLPSNTPIGTGTATVTYNGDTGPPSVIRVVPNSLGIFTVTSDGNGPGIVTYPDYSLVSTTKAANCGGVFTTCGAANPGDVLIVWATGLGPVTGSDASGAGLGVNMAAVPLIIWLGNVQVAAAYQGRSGCCIGEDQIVFTVPANTPAGCAVPLTVQINNFISNSVPLAVAPAGSRTCTPINPALTTANVIQATNASFTLGVINLKRQDNYQQGIPGFQDRVEGDFLRITVPPAVQPFSASYFDAPPLGTCQIFNSPNGALDLPIATLAGLNAGPRITVKGPNGSQDVGSGGTYRATVSASGNFFSPGTYTVSAPGGTDVPAFNASITIPALPTMTSPPPDSATPFSVTRSSGLTVTWSGGLASGVIELEGFSATDNTFTNGASFKCSVSAGSGTFTVPPSVLLAIPANNFSGLDFRPLVNPVNLTGTGLNLALVSAQYEYFAPVVFR